MSNDATTSASRQSGHRQTTPRRAGMFAHPLVREIAAILTIKLLLLAALWFAFFRADPPPAADQVGQVITGIAVPAPDLK